MNLAIIWGLTSQTQFQRGPTVVPLRGATGGPVAGERCGTAHADGESHRVAPLTPGDGGSVQLALPELWNLRGGWMGMDMEDIRCKEWLQ